MEVNVFVDGADVDASFEIRQLDLVSGEETTVRDGCGTAESS